MKFGRLPRKRDPRVPHLADLQGDAPLPPAPIAVDWSAGMPDAFGAMLNDRLGDCTCAAFYHALQIWGFDAAKVEDTEPDQFVEQLYEEACGYNPSNPQSDQGGVEQDVLTFLLNTGAPTSQGRQKLIAFVEVDVTDLDDIKRTIADCGGCYIGFNVPDTIFDDGTTWHTTTSQTIIGGHAVFVVGYDNDGLILISWGQRYRMTWAFWGAYVDEAYALLDPIWVESTGRTPSNLSVTELEAAMQKLKATDPGDERH